MRTPDQILGPYYPAGAETFTTGDLTCSPQGSGQALGEIIEITGKVRNLANSPIGGVRIVVWQANSFGRYDHPNDTASEAPLDPNFRGFGEVHSTDDGTYRLRTVKPGSYAALDGWTRAPHVHFEVHGRFERLVTQMYFLGEPLNETDRFLLSSRKPSLLIAIPIEKSVFQFDIVLTRG
jgi:protocatechuate 3,4-dioxygenase beta subunit